MPIRSSKASAPLPVPVAADVPVTNVMLGKVRTEVLQRIDQAREEGRADNQKLDAKIDAVGAKVDAVKAELTAKLDGVDAKLDATKAELTAKIDGVDAKLDAVKAELKADLHEVKAGMHGMRAQIHGVEAHLARIEALVEEQNARNKVVLDGITAVLSRQNQVEDRVTRVEENFRNLAAGRPTGE